MISTSYFSYLIRIWPGDDLPNGGWHASLEDPTTKQLIYFQSMAELFAFLGQKSLTEEKINLKKDHDNGVFLS